MVQLYNGTANRESNFYILMNDIEDTNTGLDYISKVREPLLITTPRECLQNDDLNIMRLQTTLTTASVMCTEWWLSSAIEPTDREALSKLASETASKIP